MRLAAALTVLMLAACVPKPELIVPDAPEIVRVAVDRYVALPAELTADCYDEGAKEQTYGEAKRLANLRRESLAECNARWAKVRALQPKEAKP